MDWWLVLSFADYMNFFWFKLWPWGRRSIFTMSKEKLFTELQTSKTKFVNEVDKICTATSYETFPAQPLGISPSNEMFTWFIFCIWPLYLFTAYTGFGVVLLLQRWILLSQTFDSLVVSCVFSGKTFSYRKNAHSTESSWDSFVEKGTPWTPRSLHISFCACQKLFYFFTMPILKLNFKEKWGIYNYIIIIILVSLT